jgi:hypothetical protein
MTQDTEAWQDKQSDCFFGSRNVPWFHGIGGIEVMTSRRGVSRMDQLKEPEDQRLDGRACTNRSMSFAERGFTMNKSVAFLMFFLLPNFAFGQKIGVLPFEDASGVGAEFGAQVAKFIRSEFLKHKKFLPKFVDFKPKAEETAAIDVEKAIELGRKHAVDYIVIGTILETDASSSSSGIGRVRIFGQHVGSDLRTVTANVTLQGDLISVKDGKLIESFRTDGSKTEASVGANVSTQWGSVNSDSQEGNDSPNAKALREAVEKLVEKMSEHIGK